MDGETLCCCFPAVDSKFTCSVDVVHDLPGFRSSDRSSVSETASAHIWPTIDERAAGRVRQRPPDEGLTRVAVGCGQGGDPRHYTAPDTGDHWTTAKVPSDIRGLAQCPSHNRSGVGPGGSADSPPDTAGPAPLAHRASRRGVRRFTGRRRFQLRRPAPHCVGGRPGDTAQRDTGSPPPSRCSRHARICGASACCRTEQDTRRQVSHKPDMSTMGKRGHFYCGLTLCCFPA
jgi:hypothetical protein